VSVTYNDPCSGVKFGYQGEYNAVSNFKTVAVPSKAYTGSEKNFELYNIGEKGWNLVSEYNPRSSKSIACPVSGFSLKQFAGGAYKNWNSDIVQLDDKNGLTVSNTKAGDYKIYLFSNQPRRQATDLHVIIQAEVCGNEEVTANNLSFALQNNSPISQTNVIKPNSSSRVCSISGIEFFSEESCNKTAPTGIFRAAQREGQWSISINQNLKAPSVTGTSVSTYYYKP
jgi:hypothetical protein